MTEHETKALEIIWDKNTISPCGQHHNDGDGNDYISVPSKGESIDDSHSQNSNRSRDNSTIATIDEHVKDTVRDMEDMMLTLEGMEPVSGSQEDISMKEIFKLAKKVAYGEDIQPLETPEAQEEALKQLSGVARYKLDRECLVDPFVAGRHKLKDVRKERELELAEEQRRITLIYLAVQYFKQKRDKESIQLKATVEQKLNSKDEEREYEEWEVAMKEAMLDFDVNTYLG
jgi:hypothetical protein